MADGKNPQRKTQTVDEHLTNLENRVQVLERASSMRSASIGEGGVRVYGGGSVVVDNPGRIQTKDANGRTRVQLGEAGQCGGVPLSGVQTFDHNGDLAMRLGSHCDGGQVREGIFVRNPATGHTLLHSDSGNAYMGLDDAVSGGTRPWAIYLDGTGPTHGTDQSERGFYFQNPNITGASKMFIGFLAASGSTAGRIIGGSDNPAVSGVALSFRNSDFTLRVNDGPGNNTRPIAASAFNTVPSSAETKIIDAEVGGDTALRDICSTAIRKWRHKGDPDKHVHIGPTVEDAPDSICVSTESDAPEDQGINLGDAIFTAWAAVQELSARVEALTSENKRLASTLDALLKEKDRG